MIKNTVNFLVFKINFEKSPNVLYFPQKLTQESNFVTNLTRRKSFSLLATKAKFTGLNRALGIARGGEKICEAKYLEYKKKQCILYIPQRMLLLHKQNLFILIHSNTTASSTSARCAAYCRYAEYESVFRASVSFPEELTKARKKSPIL